jgi:RNA polymerase sigma factor (sigma-70 family)
MDGFFLRSRTDAELVREALADSPAAFETLVLRYQRKAHAIAQALGAAGTAADDVVQDAFLRAFRELPTLRAPDAFGPWFLAIVRNTARKHFRRANLPVSAETLERLEGPETEGLEGEEFRELLWRKVAELPEGTREAIFLYYHENRSVRAVARTLGTTGSAVKARLKRGRDLLRERLWRELRVCLRDMLPSTREWKGRARRLALIVLASLPPAWGLQAAPPAVVPVAASAAPAFLA